jgi:hypothetical protein
VSNNNIRHNDHSDSDSDSDESRSHSEENSSGDSATSGSDCPGKDEEKNKGNESTEDYSDDEDEGEEDYKVGGYHRVKVGEVYNQRWVALHYTPSYPLFFIDYLKIFPYFFLDFMQICCHQEAWLGAFLYSMDGQRQTTQKIFIKWWHIVLRHQSPEISRTLH